MIYTDNEGKVELSDGSKFEVVAEAGYYSYDFSVAAILKDDAGQTFFAFDGGCSCTTWGERLTEADLKPVHCFADAGKALKDAEYHGIDVAEFAEAWNTAKYEGRL